MGKEVIVEVSARHVHLSQTDLELLFGVGYQLTKKKELSQPGQFACEERVDVVGPKNTIKNVVVLGPIRPATQVEVALSDARTLGLIVPIRESGDVTGSAGCTLIGPAGQITIAEGLIAAKRHLHVFAGDAEELAVQDKDSIALKITTDERSLIFHDVVVRVSDKFATAVHLDTDEANAAGFTSGSGEIVE
jgi:putative phosphotransacetylase